MTIAFSVIAHLFWYQLCPIVKVYPYIDNSVYVWNHGENGKRERTVKGKQIMGVLGSGMRVRG